jgi:hypothetical protein
MAKPKKKESGKKKLKFKYVIPDQLMDCYINGVFGGVTQRQEIHMHPFNERTPIPKEVFVEFGKEGEKPKEIEKIAGGDIVRLIQASLIMDVNAAIAIRDWLDNKIKFIKSINEEEKQKKLKKLEK